MRDLSCLSPGEECLQKRLAGHIALPVPADGPGSVDVDRGLVTYDSLRGLEVVPVDVPFIGVDEMAGECRERGREYKIRQVSGKISRESVPAVPAGTQR